MIKAKEFNKAVNRRTMKTFNFKDHRMYHGLQQDES